MILLIESVLHSYATSRRYDLLAKDKGTPQLQSMMSGCMENSTRYRVREGGNSRDFRPTEVGMNGNGGKPI